MAAGSSAMDGELASIVRWTPGAQADYRINSLLFPTGLESDAVRIDGDITPSFDMSGGLGASTSAVNINSAGG